MRQPAREAFPEELRALKQWFNATLEQDGKGGIRKIPVSPFTGKRIDATARNEHWTDFETAYAALAHYDGLSFGLLPENHLVFIDPDHCRDAQTGVIEPWARDVIGLFPHAYNEVSVSGTGAHIAVHGDWHGASHSALNIPGASDLRSRIDVFSQKRYFLMTGDLLDDPVRDIPDSQEELDELAKLFDWTPKSSANYASAVRIPHNVNARAVLESVLNLEVTDGATKRYAFHAVPGKDGKPQTCPLAGIVHGDNRRNHRCCAFFESNGLLWFKCFADDPPHAEGPNRGAIINLKLDKQLLSVPTITVTTGSNPVALDETERALVPHAERLGIFQRGGEIVRLVRLAETTEQGGIKRHAGSTIFAPASGVSLVEDMERVAQFQHYVKSKNGDLHPVRINCPPRFGAIYLSRLGKWNLPAIRGIAFSPTLRRDGSVIESAGFDRKSGIYLATDDEWPPIPHEPTKDDAVAAIETLTAPFEQFPFVSPADFAVHLAAVLTAIVRRSLESAPMFGYGAPTMRSGKSLLGGAVGIIATGAEPAATAVADDEAELKKTILAMLKAGDAVILLDNIEHVLRSPQLNSVITQPTYQDRVLGETEMGRYPTNATWCATGNNLSVSGDLVSRTLLCSIDPKMENPEARDFFKIKNLKAHLLENRIELVVAALTVLRAYVTTGKKEKQGGAWGGFDEWFNLVRGALLWAGCADPCETRENVATEDPERENAARLLAEIKEHCPGEFTVQQLIKQAYDTVRNPGSEERHLTFPELRSALAAVAGVKGTIDNDRLGKWLRTWRDRVISGLKLRRKGVSGKRTRWEVTRQE